MDTAIRYKKPAISDAERTQGWKDAVRETNLYSFHICFSYSDEVKKHLELKSPIVARRMYEVGLVNEFNQRAERWERETAIHSSPGATYLHRDYIAIIAKGMENKNVIVPLILNRIKTSGNDWFYALELIAEENPADDVEDFESAFKAWYDWAVYNGLI